MIGLESLQSFFAARDGLFVCELVAADFIGDEDLVASAFDAASHDFFGKTSTVAGRGVDHCDACIDGGMDRGDRVFLILIAPHGATGKRPGTESKFGNRKRKVG